MRGGAATLSSPGAASATRVASGHSRFYLITISQHADRRMGRSTRHMSRSEKQEVRRRAIEAERKRREHKRMAAYGLGAVCAALFAYALVANAGEQDIELVDASDAPALRDLFFDGEPRFGLCLDTAPKPGEVPGVFSSAAADLRGVCKSVALNCSVTLPGGRTVHERFRFNASAAPVAFFVANGDPPRQLRIAIDQDHRPLVEKLRKRSQPRVMSVRSSRDLQSACSRPLCALFMHEGPLPPRERQALTRYASHHRRCAPARARARDSATPHSAPHAALASPTSTRPASPPPWTGLSPR